MVKRIQVVITGANGFVAKNLRKYLSKNNIDLISISRSDFKEYKNELKSRISKNYDEKIILNKIKNSDVIIHLVGLGKQSVDIDYEMIMFSSQKDIVELGTKNS